MLGDDFCNFLYLVGGFEGLVRLKGEEGRGMGWGGEGKERIKIRRKGKKRGKEKEKGRVEGAGND